MKARLKLVLLLFLVIATSAAMNLAFRLMNAPSDVRLYSGLGIIGVLIVFVPTLAYKIMHHKEKPVPEQPKEEGEVNAAHV